MSAALSLRGKQSKPEQSTDFCMLSINRPWHETLRERHMWWRKTESLNQKTALSIDLKANSPAKVPELGFIYSKHFASCWKTRKALLVTRMTNDFISFNKMQTLLHSSFSCLVMSTGWNKSKLKLLSTWAQHAQQRSSHLEYLISVRRTTGACAIGRIYWKTSYMRLQLLFTLISLVKPWINPDFALMIIKGTKPLPTSAIRIATRELCK